MSTLRAALSRLPEPLRRSIQTRAYPDLLAEGETAPEWHLQSWDGSWHRQGKHWSVLVFYPDDAGSVCTAQLSAFQAALPAFEALDVKVLGINPAEAASHRALAERAGITFPLLTDRGASVARRFRAAIQLPFAPMLLRAVYLVNPARTIRLANRGTPSVDALVRSVQALRAASRTGM
jgi:peroxiredoxin